MGAESTDEEVTRSLSAFKWPAQRVALWAETFNERRAVLVEISSQKNQNSFAEGLVSLSLLATRQKNVKRARVGFMD